MFSVGIDMIEIPRIEKSMKKRRFLRFILGGEEYLQLEKRGFPAKSVAANFCAKEAFLKSMGLGLFKLDFKNIQVLRNTSGKPYISLSGDALAFAKKNNFNFSVSITHTKQCASAVVICFKKLENS